MSENNYDLDYTGSMVDRILDTGYDLQNQGYIFRGLASHYTGTPTERTWLIAPTGSTGFGLSSPVPPGSIGICMYNGSSWSAEILNTLTLDTAPTTGSGNGITSGAVKTLAESITNAIGQLEQSVSDRFTSLELEDTTGSLQAEVLSITLKYVFEGEEETLTSLSILAATAEKAGLMSAADKQKLDAFVTNIRSLRIQDTTEQADQGTEITNTLKWTIGGVTEAITAFTLYAATTSKAGLMSAADKTALDTLPSLINAGYLYAGIATPSTVPSSTDAKIFYIAVEVGTYTNFGNLNVTQGINIIYKSGNAWSAVQVIGIDDEPTPGSDNFVMSGGISKNIKDLEYTIDWVHLFDQEVGTSTINKSFDVHIPAGGYSLKVGISVEYASTMYMPTVFVHYEGDDSETNLGALLPGKEYSYQSSKAIDRVRIYIAVQSTWAGTYTLSACTSISERFYSEFLNKEIEIPFSVNGFRYHSMIGVNNRGEYQTGNTWKMTNIVRVGKCTVKARHIVFNGLPWLYVYKQDGTYDYYITDTPNTDVAAGTNRLSDSIIELPDSTVAIQMVTDIDKDVYHYVILNDIESVERYVNNRIVNLSDRFTVDRYSWRFGNEVAGGGSFGMTEYIEVGESDYVECGCCSTAVNDIYLGVVNATISVGFYDKDRTLISSIYRDTVGNESLFVYQKVPSRTRYVRFCNNLTKLALPYAVIHKGDNVVASDMPVASYMTPLTYDRRGKEIVMFGDSITQGESSTDFTNNSYAGILRKFFSIEHGGRMNFGFCHFAISSEPNSMISLVSATNWTRSYEDSTVLGGDKYSTDGAGSELKFTIARECHYIKVCSEYKAGYGIIQLLNGRNVIEEIDLSENPRIGYSDAIDVSSCDFSAGFSIKCKSGEVNASGIICIDNLGWWTFNNYGRSGAPATLFTGDLFTAQAKDASVIFYALGVNSGWENVYTAFESIKDEFKAINAVKVVIDQCNYSSTRISNTMPKKELIRELALYVGAQYICVGDYYPKDSNGDVVAGFYNPSDNIHPTDAGHQFIAELVAKNIGLSCNAKNITDYFEQ